MHIALTAYKKFFVLIILYISILIVHITSTSIIMEINSMILLINKYKIYIVIKFLKTKIFSFIILHFFYIFVYIFILFKMSIVSNTISKFIIESPVEHITAASVIYKAMEVDSRISEDQLYQLSNNIIESLINNKKMDSKLRAKLKKIPNQVNS